MWLRFLALFGVSVTLLAGLSNSATADVATAMAVGPAPANAVRERGVGAQTIQNAGDVNSGRPRRQSAEDWPGEY